MLHFFKGDEFSTHFYLIYFVLKQMFSQKNTRNVKKFVDLLARWITSDFKLKVLKQQYLMSKKGYC